MLTMLLFMNEISNDTNWNRRSCVYGARIVECSEYFRIQSTSCLTWSLLMRFHFFFCSNRKSTLINYWDCKNGFPHSFNENDLSVCSVAYCKSGCDSAMFSKKNDSFILSKFHFAPPSIQKHRNLLCVWNYFVSNTHSHSTRDREIEFYEHFIYAHWTWTFINWTGKLVSINWCVDFKLVRISYIWAFDVL